MPGQPVLPQAVELAIRQALIAPGSATSYAALGEALGPEKAHGLLRWSELQSDATAATALGSGALQARDLSALKFVCLEAPDRASIASQLRDSGLLSPEAIAKLLSSEFEVACLSCELRYRLFGLVPPKALRCPSCQRPCKGGAGNFELAWEPRFSGAELALPPPDLGSESNSSTELRLPHSKASSTTEVEDQAKEPALTDGGLTTEAPSQTALTPTPLPPRQSPGEDSASHSTLVPSVGMTIGPWTLDALLGRGGMGAVYRAHNSAGELAAIKLIVPADPETIARQLPRFRQEAAVLKRLSHPGIVRKLDFSLEPSPFLALEFIDGINLRQKLAEQRRINIPAAISLALQILDALQYAHDQQIIHRDLKPDNVLLEKSGRVVIADFGLGRAAGADDDRLTLTGKSMGTTNYISPEQIRDSKRVGPASDLYSFGALMFHLICGRPPFVGPQIEVISSHLRRDPPLASAWTPAISPRFQSLLQRLLQKEPGQRPASATEVSLELREIEAELAGPSDDTAFVTALALEEGAVLGDWEVEEAIGQGGMSRVFRARRGEQQAALKVLAPQRLSDDSLTRRFAREIKLMSELAHPNVVTIYDSGGARIGESLYRYMAMELMTWDLGRWLDQRGPLEPMRAAWAGHCVARALEAAHEKGIVHRDVKPENILIAGDSLEAGVPKLADFGIALLTDQESISITKTSGPLGSAHTMAPEQARGGEIDGRADVYALGASLFQLLTGRRLFAGATRDALLLAHARELPVPAHEVLNGIPENLSLLVDHAVLKRPGDRPSAAEFGADLEAWLDGSLEEDRLLAIRRQVKLGQEPFREKPTSRRQSIALVTLALTALILAIVALQPPDPWSPLRSDCVVLEPLVTELETRPSRPRIDQCLLILDGLGARQSAVERSAGPISDELKWQISALRRQTLEASWDWIDQGADALERSPGSDQEGPSLRDMRQLLRELGARLRKQPSTARWSTTLRRRLPRLRARLLRLDELAQVSETLDLLAANIQAGALERGDATLVEASREVAELRTRHGTQPSITKLQARLKASRRQLAVDRLALRLAPLRAQSAARAYEGVLAALPSIKARSRALLSVQRGPRIAKIQAEIESLEAQSLKNLATLAGRAESLGAALDAVDSEEKFRKLRGQIDALRAEIPPGNPKLLNLVSRMARREESGAVERRRVVLGIEERLRTAEQERPYAAIIDDLRRVIGTAKDETANRGRTLLRSLCAKRDAAFERALATLAKSQNLKLLAGADPAQVKAMHQSLAALPGARYRGAPQAPLALRKAAFERRLRGYPQALVARAYAAFGRSRGRAALLRSIAKTDRLLRAARAHGLRSPRLRLAEDSIAELRRLHALGALGHEIFLPGATTIIGKTEPGFAHSPQWTTTVKDLYFDRHEVSVAEFQRFLSFEAMRRGQSSVEKLSECPRDWRRQRAAPELPVRSLSLAAAQAYARWAGKRLPSEIEWEFAARSRGRRAGPFPWGAGPEPSPSRARFGQTDAAGPLPATSLPKGATADGLLNMAGNVAEWTTSLFSPYPEGVDNLFKTERGHYVVRGGRYDSTELELVLWDRVALPKDEALPSVGFRCVSDP